MIEGNFKCPEKFTEEEFFKGSVMFGSSPTLEFEEGPSNRIHLGNESYLHLKTENCLTAFEDNGEISVGNVDNTYNKTKKVGACCLKKSKKS